MKNRFLSAALLAAMCLSLCIPAWAVSSTETVPCTYDSVGVFSEGLAAVERNGKWGFIDKTGAVVVPLEYDSVDSFCEGLAVVEQEWKRGFIDKTGAVVVPLEYDDIDSFSEGLAAVMRNWKWGFIDKTGAVVVPLEYDDIDSFSEGLARVEQEWRYGFIDKTGAVVVPLEYDDAASFSEGFAAVERNDKWGFIDKTGAVVVPLEYDGVESFSEGLARVELEGKFGFIDKSSWQSVSRTYDSAHPSFEDVAAQEQSDSDMDMGADGIAYARTQTVELDGKMFTLSTYALAGLDGSEAGYVRLRDIACLLNGTAAAFNVDWDGAVSITTKTAYAPDGSELKSPFAGDRAYRDSTGAVRIDGVLTPLHAIMLTDDNGGGYTYCKLSDLGRAIGFAVNENVERGVIIATV